MSRAGESESRRARGVSDAGRVRAVLNISFLSTFTFILLFLTRCFAAVLTPRSALDVFSVAKPLVTYDILHRDPGARLRSPQTMQHH